MSLEWLRREWRKRTTSAQLDLSKVFLSAALETIGWSIITPGLPTLHQSLSLSSSSVGSISALISVIALASVVIQGMASDAMGRVRLLSISSAAQLIGHLVLFFFAKGHMTSIWIFVAFRVLPSIFKCGMIVSQAYVIDWISAIPEDKDDDLNPDASLNTQQLATKHISTLMAYTNLGFIVGPVLGGQLSAMDPSYPFSAGCLVFLVNLALLTQMKDPPREDLTRSQSNDHLVDPENGGGGGGIEDYGNNRMRLRPGPHAASSSSLMAARSSIRPRRKYLTPVALVDSEFSPFLSLQQGGTSGSTARPSHTHNSRSQQYVRRQQNSLTESGLGPLQPSLTWLLHVKFAFQVGNAIYESLFAQHLKDRLSTSSQTLGWLLGLVGLEAAFVNGVLVRFVLAEPARMWPSLIVSSLLQSLGLALWALCGSFSSAATGAALIALSSNTFLSIIQGQIARHSEASAASDDAKSGKGRAGGAGRTFGLSTSIDRAARSIAPIIGSIALENFGLVGFATTAGLTGLYTAAVIVLWIVANQGGGSRSLKSR